ncbi:hypothetical protein PAHAL_9G117900 [Panicum hallii]|uniref:PRONE domain-containing protein n=1 Tax=Panicum hallii TaxID=206008 RepID=A0A2T8I0X3_9POAL|nr:hypothetical protein PAHAL_9G117900 [Panicum hallii]
MMDTEKRDLLAEHAEGLLDVGKSILESYSRVLESLASNIIAQIDDLLNVDELSKLCPARQRSAGPCWSTAGRTTPRGPEPREQRRPRLTGPARGCQARLDASAASVARLGVRADGENRVERARERGVRH